MPDAKRTAKRAAKRAAFNEQARADETEEGAVCHATCAANFPMSVWLPTCAFAKRKDPARVEELIAALHPGHRVSLGAALCTSAPL